MFFGVARELITPYVKTNISCTGKFGVPFEGIHDDVYVKAFVLDDGKTKALIVATDLLFHNRSLNHRVEEYAGKYNVPKENIVINHSHNHNAPSCFGYDDEHVSQAYEDFLQDRLERCIDRAFANTFEGEMSYTSIEEFFLNVNRRRLMADGTIQNRPNHMGPKDSMMDVLKVCDKKGRIRILLVCYSCHAAFYPDLLEISADYPGRLCQRLENQFYGCTAMFLQGSGGNTKANISSRGERFIQMPYEEIDHMAMIMENKISKAIIEGSFIKEALDLGGVTFEIPIDLEPAPIEYFEKAVGQRPSKPLLSRNAERIIKNYDYMPHTIYLYAGILKLSPDLCIAHTGGEPCYEVEEIVNKALENKKVIFSGYSDAIAYIPTDHLIPEGGYEVDSFLEYGNIGPFKLGVDQKIFDAFQKGGEKLFK
ncbi:MAG TPA: hypothetical protein DDZ89_21730 [Clostridiales bacterium]|nr:hypothetical protein [Clostridiales bacterium]